MENTDAVHEPIYQISANNDPHLFENDETIVPFVKWGISIKHVDISKRVKIESIMFKCTIDFETLKILDYVFITTVPVFSTRRNGNLVLTPTQKYHHTAAELIEYVYGITENMLHMDDIEYTTGEILSNNAIERLHTVFFGTRNYENIIVGSSSVRTKIYQTMLDKLKDLIFAEYPEDSYHDVAEPHPFISKSG